jgi:class 3 adenylate cyclase
MGKSDKLFRFIKESRESDFDVLAEELDRRFGETCATLVLDSSGFTRTTMLLGSAFFLSIICRMREVCFKEATRFRAISSRVWADNFFAEFESVDDAVAAAFAIHRYFKENPIPLLHTQDYFGVCIGIGFGRGLRSDHEGIYGSEMNLASKLGEDIAVPGETLLTEAAFLSLRNPESFTIQKSVQTISGVQMFIYSLQPRKD